MLIERKGPVAGNQLALGQVFDVSHDRERGRFHKPLVDGAVNLCHHVRDRRGAITNGLEDRLLAPLAMDEIGFDRPERLFHAPTVARQIEPIAPGEQNLQRSNVV